MNNSSTLSHINLLALNCYFLYGFVAVTGNVIMIRALCKAQLTRYGGYTSLVHYAVTDIISGSLYVFYVTPMFIAGDIGIPKYLFGFVMTFSEFSRKTFIVFMAVTKFGSVLRPLTARRIMTRKWYRKALLVTWMVCPVVSLPLWIPRYIYFDPVKYTWVTMAATRKFTSLYGSCVNLTVTVVIMVAYPVCFYKLVRRDRVWDNDQPAATVCVSNRPTFSGREKSLLYIFALNAGVFLLYWIPIYVFEIWQFGLPYYGFFKETFRGLQISYNPIVYYFLNGNIRSAINNLLGCTTKRVSSSAVTVLNRQMMTGNGGKCSVQIE